MFHPVGGARVPGIFQWVGPGSLVFEGLSQWVGPRSVGFLFYLASVHGISVLSGGWSLGPWDLVDFPVSGAKVLEILKDFPVGGAWVPDGGWGQRDHNTTIHVHIFVLSARRRLRAYVEKYAQNQKLSTRKPAAKNVAPADPPRKPT